MARQQDPSVGRQRLVALGAVAGLSAATAFAFGRVFAGRLPTLGLITAALASVVVAGLLERRGLALALLASGLGLMISLAWIVFPQTAWYGLPTMKTLRAAARSLEFVAQQARVQVAPTPALPPLMLAAVTATWTAAFSTHALAIRAGSPLLAVMPSVALVGFADTVLEDGARPVYAIVFLLAALTVVFVDGLRRVRQWGPIWSAFKRRGLSRIAARGARRVAVPAVLAAVLVPGLLPGFRAGPLVDLSTTGDDGIRLDPFVSIQAQLEREEPVDLFEVTSSSGAAYWRLYALDRFDGTTWSSSDPRAQNGQVLETPAHLPAVIPPAAGRLPQRYEILRDLDDPWLPMAYPAEAVTLPSGEFRYDPDLGTAVLDGGLEEGFEYTVQSRIVAPTPQELDLAVFDEPSQYRQYTFLPSGLDPRVGELARRWTEVQSAPYRKILAIQERFLDGSFEYDLDVEPVSDAEALFEFLTNGRRGFCQQFATAMAVLVRELGYPARVAVGFRSGTPEDDTFLVASKDAHAWVEVFFPGSGWLPFEPTPGPGFANPIARPGTYLNPTSVPELGGQTGTGTSAEGGAVGAGDQNCTTAGGGSIPGQLANADPNACEGDGPRNRPERVGSAGDLPPGFLGGIAPAPEQDDSGYSIPYRWILLGLAAAAGLLLLAVPTGKWLLRRRVLGRSSDPRERVLAAYRVFDGRAADLRLGRRQGETLQEHQARLAATVTMSDGHLGRLTAAAGRAAYAEDPPSADDAQAAERDAETTLVDLRRDAGWMRRIVGTYRPGI